MFKLLVLFPLLSLTFAAPAAELQLLGTPAHIQVHEAALAKVGDVVESVPTAVSHHSSTIVHNRAQRVTPILAPAVRSYAAPAVTTYAAASGPLLHHVALPLGLGPAAAFVHAHAPYQLRSFGNPVYAGYAGYSYGSPFVYSAFRK